MTKKIIYKYLICNIFLRQSEIFEEIYSQRLSESKDLESGIDFDDLDY